MMRTLGIWIFGLLASLIVGGIIGSRFDRGYSDISGTFGAIAGAFSFACARLWLAPRAG